MDVYVDSVADPAADVTLPGIGYGTVSGYRAVPPGTYTVSTRRAGADPRTPPVLSTTVAVGDGTASTVAGVGHFADLGLRVLQDDLATPPAGSARVRVVAAAARAGTVDVSVAGGPSVATGLPFAATSFYVDVPAGRTALQVAPAGAAATSLPVTVAPGAVYSVLVLDEAGGGLAVRPVLDAAGPGVVPSGSVAAGEGGTAGGTAGGVVVPVGAGVAGLAAVALLGTFLPGTVRWVLGAVVLLGAGVALTGGTAGGGPPAWVAAARVPAPPVPAVQLADGPSSMGAVPPPVRVRVPGIAVDSRLVPLTVDLSGALTPPEDTATAGWLAQGTAPGAVGPAVIAGHVDSVRGPGVFFRLGRVAPGDVVLVDRADGSTLAFVVTAVDSYPKDAFPTDRVYAPTPGPELRLITCGGAFDRSVRSYEADVVVTARLSG